MKKIYAQVKLTNYGQSEAAAMELIPPEEVRTVRLRGRIDTGCTHLAIPEELARELGLRKIGKTKVRYATGRTGKRPYASAVEIELNGRTAIMRPIIGHRKTELLIGNPVLEEMDLFVNTKSGKLYPNPESPDMPLAEILS